MITDYKIKIRKYLELEKKIIGNLDIKAINQVMNILEESRLKGGTIYICGNGGSASTASHMTCDFNKGISLGRKEKYNIICLNDNVPILMAYANDLGYEWCFQKQLEGRLKKNDLLVAVSVSGNSKNIIKAVEYAVSSEIKVISLTGYDGGTLAGMSNYNIHVPVDNMQIAEDIHIIINHLMTWILANEEREN